eukprot:gene7649-15657_t
MDISFTSHDGLRGAASLWIMFYHCIDYSDFSFDLQGPSVMPLFFLLSGYFTMISCFGGEKNIKLNDSPQYLAHFPVFDFYRNRFARVYPTYILSILLALPVWYLGYGYLSPKYTLGITLSIINSILPLNTTFMFLLGVPINGPAVIPILGFWPAYALSAMNPFTRFPLFLMGTYAGELTIRWQQGQEITWLPSFLLFFPYTLKSSTTNNINYNSSKLWSSKATKLSLLLLISTLLVTLQDSIAIHIFHIPSYFNRPPSTYSRIWFQAIIPFIHLELIISLALANKNNSVISFLNSYILQWLGQPCRKILRTRKKAQFKSTEKDS